MFIKPTACGVCKEANRVLRSLLSGQQTTNFLQMLLFRKGFKEAFGVLPLGGCFKFIKKAA